jgi:hypothetical protein
MYGTRKMALFQNWTVNLAQLHFCSLITYTDNDAIRMQKVQDGCPFLEKFRVRGDKEAAIGVAPVNGQSTP